MRKTIAFVLVLALDMTTQTAKADFTFGTPANLGARINTSAGDDPDCLSADGLELYLDSDRPGGQGWDIWVARRHANGDEWDEPQNLGPMVNSPSEDGIASIAADGLTLYFYSNRSGGYGSFDIYMTTRATRNDSWGMAVNLGSKINSAAVEDSPWISTDGLELYFNSMRSGGYGKADLWVSTRATTSDSWGAPVNLGATVNSPYDEWCTWLSPDDLKLLFASTRPGGFGGFDLWMAARPSTGSAWGPPPMWSTWK